MTQRAWSKAWAIWTAATVGSFAVLETIALSRKSHPTYSCTLARWAGCYPPAPRGRLTPPLFLAACVWLAVHVIRYRVPEDMY